jgi:hypothetical protein
MRLYHRTINKWSPHEQPELQEVHQLPACDDSQKRIIVLPGVKLFDMSNERSISGYAELGEYLAGGKAINKGNHNLGIYCIGYTFGTDIEESNLQLLRDEHVSDGDATRLANYIIAPFIALPKEEQTFENLAEYFQKITLVGHSYGVTFSSKLSATLATQLERRFDKEDIKQALKHITFIGIAGATALDSSQHHFTSVVFGAPNDQVVESLQNDWQTKLPHISIKERTGYNDLPDALSIKPVGDHLFISSPVPEVVVLPDGERVDPDAHNMKNHTVSPPSKRGYADIIHRTMLNAINREGNITPMELITSSPKRLIDIEASDFIDQEVDRVIGAGLARGQGEKAPNGRA